MATPKMIGIHRTANGYFMSVSANQHNSMPGDNRTAFVFPTWPEVLAFLAEHGEAELKLPEVGNA